MVFWWFQGEYQKLIDLLKVALHLDVIPKQPKIHDL